MSLYCQTCLEPYEPLKQNESTCFIKQRVGTDIPRQHLRNFDSDSLSIARAPLSLWKQSISPSTMFPCSFCTGHISLFVYLGWNNKSIWLYLQKLQRKASSSRTFIRKVTMLVLVQLPKHYASSIYLSIYRAESCTDELSLLTIGFSTKHLAHMKPFLQCFALLCSFCSSRKQYRRSLCKLWINQKFE